MTKRVLLIGGYGNFGSHIAERLAPEAGLTLIVAGRSREKAREAADRLGAEWARVDIEDGLDRSLNELRPDILIHTSGPFQTQGYGVAESCIRNGVHYLDLADARDFVVNIDRLDEAAKAAGVLIVSGASTVPGLTSAILAKHAQAFHQIHSVDFGIATAQKTNRGRATVEAVLGYAGKPFTTLSDGAMRPVFGWQDLTSRRLRGLGRRLLGNCDIPDLALFPRHYPSLKSVRFRAGLELPFLHLGLWMMTWLVRARIIGNLRDAAPILLRLSNLLNIVGTDDSGFYMETGGVTAEGQSRKVTFELTARAGDGLMIPCTPAIVLCLGLVAGTVTQRGAMPCMGLAALDDMLAELARLRINWEESVG
jgi:NAD(P)-dependent dehydrogenase (short-subunit alcohol dehydrogenase family)